MLYFYFANPFLNVLIDLMEYSGYLIFMSYKSQSSKRNQKT